MMRRTKVLIVDDSAVIRQVLRQVLESDPAIEVIGAAADPLFAMKRMAVAWPDVIILDVEMPRMDGLTFLRKIMAEHPTPVVMCSTLTERGAETTMQALAAGAVDVIAKPKLNARGFFEEETLHLLRAVKSAAAVTTERLARRRVPSVKPAPPQPNARVPVGHHRRHIVALGTSTGGTQALEAVLSALPAECPGLVIVQHMPEKFTAAFAARLDGLCRLRVREAQGGEPVLAGQALIAPGGRHMQVVRRGGQYRVEVKDGPPVNRHRPSVDVLFRSVARHAGADALGVIMTGMGDDGAAGLAEMRAAGAATVAQDEATCVVFGMPKEAIRRGAAEAVLPLDAIPQAIVRHGEGGNYGCCDNRHAQPGDTAAPADR